MDWKRILEPSVIVSVLNFVLLLVLLFSRSGNSEPLSQMTEFEEAMSAATSKLNGGDLAHAYDMVMVASRIAPSDPRLFVTVANFIEKAIASKDEETLALAEDLLDRGDSLVHFQSPSNVSESRKQLNELRQRFQQLSPTAAIPNPFDSVTNLVKIAEDKSQPLFVRSRAVERARSEFDDLRFDAAVTQSHLQSQGQHSVPADLADQIEHAEMTCISDLFLESKPKIEAWLTETQSLTKNIDAEPADKVPELSKKLAEQISQGFAWMQQMMPYSKSNVEGALAMSKDVEKRAEVLQRQKNWLYNQQVLRLIRDLESHNDWTSEDKIRHLAEVKEELLSPYVLRRHNDLWEKVFESLPDEEKKVSAVRLRILRQNE